MDEYSHSFYHEWTPFFTSFWSLQCKLPLSKIYPASSLKWRCLKNKKERFNDILCLCEKFKQKKTLSLDISKLG